MSEFEERLGPIGIIGLVLIALGIRDLICLVIEIVGDLIY